MRYTKVNLEEKILNGIQIKCYHGKEETTKDIGNLWKRYFEEDYMNKIKNQKTNYCICLYSDYDMKEGSYLTTIGREVTKSELFNDLKEIKIIKGTYLKFVVTGNVVTAVCDFWKKLWEMKDIKRTFTGDFEASGLI